MIADRQQARQNSPDAYAFGNWLLVIVPAAMLVILLLRPTTNSDMFWQLKLGELTLAQGRPIVREPFAALHLGEALSTVAWVGQAIMALVLEVFGWKGLRLFDALCWCGGYWAVAAACRRMGGSPIGIASGMALAFMAALPTAILRPQNFSALCFGLLLALLRLELRWWQTVLFGVPLLIAWQNLHASVTVAAGVLAVAAAAGWLRYLRDRSRRMPIAETILTPAAAISVFCTPDGWSILATSLLNQQLSVAIGVSEWLPLWHPINHAAAVPIAIVAMLTAYALWPRRAAIDLQELAIAIALLIMTALVYRFVLFWAISLVPLVARTGARNLDQLVLDRKWQCLFARPLPRWTPLFAVLAIGLAVSALKPIRFKPHLALPAIARLQQEGVSGTIFSEFYLGGPLIFAGYPQWKVAYDGRYYRYTPEEWDRFSAIRTGRFGLEKIVSLYRPVAFVLHAQSNPKLIAEINGQPRKWRRIWRDDDAVIFVANTERPRAD